MFLYSHCSQITKGYEFESETDTEVIPKLVKYVYDNRESDSITFSKLVERVIQQLVSSYTTKHSHKLTPMPYFITRGCCDIKLPVTLEEPKSSFLFFPSSVRHFFFFFF